MIRLIVLMGLAMLFGGIIAGIWTGEDNAWKAAGTGFVTSLFFAMIETQNEVYRRGKEIIAKEQADAESRAFFERNR